MYISSIFVECDLEGRNARTFWMCFRKNTRGFAGRRAEGEEGSLLLV